jgi:hypothetical protein
MYDTILSSVDFILLVGLPEKKSIPVKTNKI